VLDDLGTRGCVCLGHLHRGTNERHKPWVTAELEFLTKTRDFLERAHHYFMWTAVERAQGVKTAVIQDLRARVKAASF
jgi:hypothetical protein